MKKNKKLFAILTLVAFMMTLMPVMAFAEGGVTIERITVESRNGYMEFTASRTNTDTAGSAAIVLEGVNAASVNTNATTPAALKLRSTDAVINFSFGIGQKESKAYVAAQNPQTTSLDKAFSNFAGFSGTDLAQDADVPTAKDVLETAGETVVAGVISQKATIVATKNADTEVESKSGATGSTIDPKDDRTVELEVVLRNLSGDAVKGNAVLYIWVEESGAVNQASDALVLSTDKAKNGNVTIAKQRNGVYKVTTLGNEYATPLYAQFLRSGEFTIKASFDSKLNDYKWDSTLNSGNGDWVAKTNAELTTTFGGIVKLNLDDVETGKKTITVTTPNVNTSKWGINVNYVNKTDADWPSVDLTKAASGKKDWDKIEEITLANGKDKAYVAKDGGKVGHIEALADTVAVTPVTLTVYNEDGKAVSNRVIELEAASANIELSKTTITTDYAGKASFDVAGVREGEYKIYVTIGDYESTLIVKVSATAANTIETIKFPSNPIATDTDVDDYKNIFRFLLTDANGNIVVKDAKDGLDVTRGAEKATDPTCAGDNKKYVSIVKAPEANKVKDADLYLKRVPNKDYYTFAVSGGKKFEAEGDYEVKIVLDNGKSVTVPFEVKKFDKAVSLHIEYPTEAVELNAQTDAPDIYFLDANGVTKKAEKRVTVAASGYAVANVNVNGEAGVIKVKNDEKYLGQTITVTAVAEKENLSASTTLTVTDSAQSIKLDTTRGQVNASNRIGFKLVNSNGQAAALGNDTYIDDVTCIVTNVENPDAKVSFSVGASTKSDLQSNGTGTIMLSSNKETKATVQIMVKATKKNITSTNTNNNAGDNNTGLSTTYYTGTETFTFGAEADKSVVMTIGSKEIVANNVPSAIDVAPFIKDNRTFVPFRALVEAFGAEVSYDEATSTVTTKLDGKTVVLTVGSTVLTVNDETVTMDVAPYIVDDRVVVPVRFVGEAFGFTVEATQDAETGATASVVFYQK